MIPSDGFERRRHLEDDVVAPETVAWAATVAPALAYVVGEPAAKPVARPGGQAGLSSRLTPAGGGDAAAGPASLDEDVQHVGLASER